MKKPTQLELKYLCDRLESIRRAKPRRYEPIKMQEPRDVIAARKQIERSTVVIDAWGEKLSERGKQRDQNLSKAYDACRRLIEFGDAAAALKALDEFESKEF
jgi:hypothetical protein